MSLKLFVSPEGVYSSADTKRRNKIDFILIFDLMQVISDAVDEYSTEEVVAFYTYHPEFERFTTYTSNWKTTTFKKVCAGLGYRINPDREGNRWLKSVNGENKALYQIVPQEGAVKGVLSTDTEAAPEPPAPPVVENGRFSQVFFGDDLQEDDDK